MAARLSAARKKTAVLCVYIARVVPANTLSHASPADRLPSNDARHELRRPVPRAGQRSRLCRVFREPGQAQQGGAGREREQRVHARFLAVVNLSGCEGHHPAGQQPGEPTVQHDAGRIDEHRAARAPQRRGEAQHPLGVTELHPCLEQHEVGRQVLATDRVLEQLGPGQACTAERDRLIDPQALLAELIAIVSYTGSVRNLARLMSIVGLTWLIIDRFLRKGRSNPRPLWVMNRVGRSWARRAQNWRSSSRSLEPYQATALRASI